MKYNIIHSLQYTIDSMVTDSMVNGWSPPPISIYYIILYYVYYILIDPTRILQDYGAPLDWATRPRQQDLIEYDRIPIVRPHLDYKQDPQQISVVGPQQIPVVGPHLDQQQDPNRDWQDLVGSQQDLLGQGRIQIGSSRI